MPYQPEIVIVYAFHWGLKVYLGEDKGQMARMYAHLSKRSEAVAPIARIKMEKIPGRRYIGRDRTIWNEGPNPVTPLPGWPVEVM